MAQSKTQFGYRRHPDQDRGGNLAEHPVVVVGAGPVGLSLAIDLAQRGQAVVLLDDADRIGEGSRAICFSKRSLEYWDRLGIGQRMVDKGVVWSVGKIFHGASLLYQFNLLPEEGHKRPAFINLQQFHAEAYLVDRVQELPAIDLRWRNKVIGLEQRNDHVVLTIETPDGPYRLRASYVVACDGARSSLRQMVGAEFAGQVFEDQFLIADVKMTAEFPTERWFWFDPPFHAGRSALLHKQPDDIWRIDLQLHPDADPAVEKQPDNVRPQDRAHARARQVRVRMDFALQIPVPPDGEIHPWPGDLCRRCRASGLAVRRARRQFRAGGRREPGLEARSRAAKEFAGNPARELSRRAQRRGRREHPRSPPARPISWRPARRRRRGLRKAVLSLARETEFGKRMINGGRLSVPSIYDSPLSTADRDAWRGGPRPGRVHAGCADCRARRRSAFI